MRSSTVLVALSAPLLALAAPVMRRASDPNTLAVLQFAHVLEQLETTFYTEALAKFVNSDFTTAGFPDPNVPIQQFTTILGDESTHTSVLASTIQSFGATPLNCSFDFSSVLTDVKTMAGAARLVENLGVSAYLGGATIIQDPQILSAAASILTVEARHQTMLNLLNAGSTISSAFDMVLSPPQVLSTAQNFIKGDCPLGLPINPSLSVTNTGTVAPGTKVTLSSSAITGDTSGLTCQMLVGGAAFAIAQPFDNCIVPSGINGLVYIFVTNTTQPLLSNIQNQFAASIVAGPTGAFIDTQTEAISQVVLGKSAVAASSGDSSTTTTSTISPDAASSLASSLASPTPTGAPGNAAGTPTPAADNAPGNSAAVAGGPNMATGPNGPVNVVGWSSVPARR